MKCIQVGLIGFGFAGRIFHSSAIQAVEGLELAAIVQRSGSEAATAFPHVRILTSVEALLKDSSIQLVVVATPNASHLPIARQCLLAGRDVVIDKPFALSSTEAAELIQLARDRGRLLSVYQNRRWDGDFLTVRKLLEDDRLGRLVMFESHYDRFRLLPRLHAWREDGGLGGGVLFDLGAHLVDQALVLFGVPASVWAVVRMEREGARLTTPSTCTCTTRRLIRRPCLPASACGCALLAWRVIQDLALPSTAPGAHSENSGWMARRPICSPGMCFLPSPGEWRVRSTGERSPSMREASR